VNVSHVITDECVLCGICLEHCPVGAISAGPERCAIDAARCDNCGACVEACPQECILHPAALTEHPCPDD
jgi:NAD-dependent dihydropyrimidine dehydrogenase PreA subunit